MMILNPLMQRLARDLGWRQALRIGALIQAVGLIFGVSVQRPAVWDAGSPLLAQLPRGVMAHT